LLFVIAGSTSFKAIRRAVEDVGDAISSPKALPPRKPSKDINTPVP
jgi:hypothetical protein